ncbi:hypothetical protein, partial [Vibrio cholerae]|uniref:hypothetical protein n=1 Tax=Vibrio cholerae TaxID=666 RepID=UPI001F17FB99
LQIPPSSTKLSTSVLTTSVLSTPILGNLEASCTNVSSFFGKICDISKFTKEIKDKLSKIDEDLKASAQQLQLDPS